MLSPGSTGAPKWEIAKQKMLNDYAALPANTEIGIVGFGNTSSVPDPYSTTYLDLAAGWTKASKNADILTKLNLAATPNSSYLTPLAGGACDAIDVTFTAKPNCDINTTARQVYLYSDGLENSTPDYNPCYSAISSSTPFDVSKEGQGYGLTPDSWQWRVANKALTGSPDLVTPIPGTPQIIVNVSLLFDFTNSLSSGDPDEFDGLPAGADLQSVDANGVAFFSGLAKASNGSYFEAKKVNGVATKMPVPGDTDPTPTYSCVNQADTSRVLQAQGRTVRANDPLYSEEDLAKRDVNNDLKINSLDYQVVLANYGKCS